MEFDADKDVTVTNQSEQFNYHYKMVNEWPLIAKKAIEQGNKVVRFSWGEVYIRKSVIDFSYIAVSESASLVLSFLGPLLRPQRIILLGRPRSSKIGERKQSMLCIYYGKAYIQSPEHDGLLTQS
jgi:hypothetical protein